MTAQPINIKFNREIFTAENLFILCLILFPVFTLSLQRWISICLFIAFGSALYILAKKSPQRVNDVSTQVSKTWLAALLITLATPLVAIGLGQLFRQELILPAFDNASRFLLVVPIVLVIIRKKINTFKLLEYVVPATILVTALSILIHPSLRYGASRLTTYFVDPLTFGSICLSLALISLVSIDFYKTDMLWVRLYKLSGFLIGLYMSFISGSRTGWMAIPMVLWIWLRVKKNIPHWLILALVTVFCAGIYLFIPMVKIRVDAGLSEFLNYQWNALNPDTSIELRMSFARIGWFLFCQNPLGGWGDTGFKALLNSPQLMQFATPFATELTMEAGFHNEITTNMVRSGIWGLLSSAALFAVPIALFVEGLRSQSALTRNHALIAISYIVCVLVSGMSTEVFNLKFTAAFHAMMIACFTGSLLVVMSSEKNIQSL
ncbi:MAG: O-antigen ligase family protein [Burkholderiaceae bacterium]